MTSRQRRVLNRLLIERDGYVCGRHMGGCGEQAHIGSETDLDHIFPQAFFRDTNIFQPHEYNGVWNLQRMHKTCNNESKGGFLFGFPVFKCACHWLQIKEHKGKHALEVLYCPARDQVFHVVVVPFGKFDVGDGTISDPKGLLPSNEDHVVAGYIQVPDRGMSISSISVDADAMFAGARKSFSFVGKAKKGTLKRGMNAHTLPLLSLDEVVAFNQFEKNRVKHGGFVSDRNNLVAGFNSEVVPLEITYNETTSNKV